MVPNPVSRALLEHLPYIAPMQHYHCHRQVLAIVRTPKRLAGITQAAVDALKEPTSLLEKAWLQRDVVATLQGVRSSADPLSRPVRASTAEQHHSTKHFPGRNVEQGHSSRLAHNDGKTSQPESPRRGQVGSPSAAWQHVLRQQASLRRSHRIGGRRVSKAARALLQQGRPRGPWLKLHRLFTDGVVISQDDGIIGGFANEGARVLVTLTGRLRNV